jgi:hypothetical protein
MNAIKYRMECPITTLKLTIRGIIDYAARNDFKGMLVKLDGTLNSAIIAHLAYEARINGGLEKLIFFKTTTATEIPATKAIMEVIDAYPTDSYSLVVSPYEGYGNLRYDRQMAAIAYAVAAKEECFVISNRDLTDYFIGEPIPMSDEYPALVFMLKSEVERFGKVIIDWNNENLEKDKADPRNTSIDNPLAAQENPSTSDFALCTVLAAKESECQILLRSYSEHPIQEMFKRTRIIRKSEGYDYNSDRKLFFEDAAEITVD